MPKKKAYPQWVPPSLKRRLEQLPEEIAGAFLRNSEAALEDPRIRHLISQTQLSKLAGQIRARLARGQTLNLAKVAQFLAWLASCDEDELPWTVKTGLRWLGIDRIQRTRGRPVGRESDRAYFIEVKAQTLWIERTGFWDWKKSLQKEAPNRWEMQLRSSLHEAKWPASEIDATILHKTTHSLAIQLAAHRFGVQYDTVQKAIRRYGRRLTNPTRTNTH